MKKNWPEAIKLLLAHEGGYVNHPRDPGGATNWGITLKVLQDWRDDDDLTARDVFNLSVDEAKKIYKAWYWDRLRCDELPSGLDYALFDYGVNSGVGQAAKTLQRLLRVTPDGQIGPKTLASAAKRDAMTLIADISIRRLEFLMGLRGWKDFGRGWKRRVLEVNNKALLMSAG